MSTRERIAVQRALVRDADTVTARIIEVVEREIPAYADTSPAQRDEVSAIAAWAIRRTVEMWVDDTAMTDADLRRFRGIGAVRATDGRPLPAILRAYRVAAVETAEVLLELGGESLEVSDVAALNRTMLVGVDELSEAVFIGYEEASRHLAMDRDRVLSALAADLLMGRQTSRAALADRSAQLGITISPRLALTLTVPRAAPPVPLPLLRHVTADHAVYLSETAADLGPEPPRAVVLSGLAIAQLPRAYRLAAGALATAPARAYRRRSVLGLADVLLLAVLTGSDADAADELPAAALDALLEPRHAAHLAGLMAYLDHGSATGAADALGIHPQTVRHRLRRVRSLAGRDLDDGWDRLVLEAACTTLSVRGQVEVTPAAR